MSESPTLYSQRTLEFTSVLGGEKSKRPSGALMKAFLPKLAGVSWQDGDVHKPLATLFRQRMCSRHSERGHNQGIHNQGFRVTSRQRQVTAICGLGSCVTPIHSQSLV